MSQIRRYTSESLSDIVREAQAYLADAPAGFVWDAEVIDPDVSAKHFAGESLIVGGVECRYRPWKTWFELAETLGCVLNTPHVLEDGFVRIRLRRLDDKDAWHLNSDPSGKAEKYGVGSGFDRIDKFEDPAFAAHFMEAIDFAAPRPKARCLFLGVNQGDEVGMFVEIMGPQRSASMSFVGIDHSPSAIEVAQKKFGQSNIEFVLGDLRDLDEMELGSFDVVVALNTLQSPGFDGQAIIRRINTHFLNDGGSFILGFPNDRYIDHAQLFGPRVKNYREPEMSLLLKDVMGYRRYLHQQKFVVKVFGKHTILMAARRLT